MSLALRSLAIAVCALFASFSPALAHEAAEVRRLACQASIAASLLPPDIFRRAMRMQGHPVLMVSGSDCHGTAIRQGAVSVRSVELMPNPLCLVQAIYQPTRSRSRFRKGSRSAYF